MGLRGRGATRTRERRPNQNGRLHAVAGRLLVHLLTETERLAAGTPAEREMLQNNGVKWDAAAIAEAVGTSSSHLNHMRERLTAHALLVSTATGSGNGRRVRFVRLVGRGIEEAESFRAHQRSVYQQGRYLDKQAGIHRAEEEERYYAMGFE